METPPVSRVPQDEASPEPQGPRLSWGLPNSPRSTSHAVPEAHSAKSLATEGSESEDDDEDDEEMTERQILLDRVNKLVELVERTLGFSAGLDKLRRQVEDRESTLQDLQTMQIRFAEHLEGLRTGQLQLEAGLRAECEERARLSEVVGFENASHERFLTGRLESSEVFQAAIEKISREQDVITHAMAETRKHLEQLEMRSQSQDFEDRVFQLEHLIAASADMFDKHAKALNAFKTSHADLAMTTTALGQEQVLLLDRLQSAQDQLMSRSQHPEGGALFEDLRQRIEKLEDSPKAPGSSDRLESVEKALACMAGQMSFELESMKAGIRQDMDELLSKVESSFKESFHEGTQDVEPSTAGRPSLASQARRSSAVRPKSSGPAVKWK